MQPDRTFAHRIAAKGIIESICMTCFLTMSRRQTQAEAEEAEIEHVCQGRSRTGPIPVSPILAAVSNCTLLC